jgi:hypothetical protein
MNLERAYATMEAVGLRSKLIRLGNKNELNSMAQMMNREPLRSFKLGQGSGATAKDLGISTLYHKTNGLIAFESITKPRNGSLNFFVSYQSREGEQIESGVGVMASVKGSETAKPKGFYIEMSLRPEARLGTDFEIYEGEVRLLNKAALQSMTPSSYHSQRKNFAFETIESRVYENLKFPKAFSDYEFLKARKIFESYNVGADDDRHKEIIKALNHIEIFKPYRSADVLLTERIRTCRGIPESEPSASEATFSAGWGEDLMAKPFVLA